MTNTENQFEYDVALSFAGENRADAKRFADLLTAKHVRVFYDDREAADLWGKELVVHLAEIYGKKARYCVMFISQYYPLKKWTNLERKYAQARAFRDLDEYILPIRLDDTEVPGITETIGYMDLRQNSMENIVNLLEQKLAKAKKQTAKSLINDDVQPSEQQSEHTAFGSIPMPKLKKLFTQLQKDRFVRESLDFIKKYFQQALKQLEGQSTDIQTDFFEITTIEFTCKVYLQETVKAQCSIWLGDTLLPNAIYYNESANRAGHNSFNDYLYVDDNGEELRLHISNFGIGIVYVEDPLATQQQAAQYLWRRFTSHFEYR